MNSSITFKSFKVRPSTVVSNWKSNAHSTFGRIGHIAPTWVPMPVRRFLRRLYGTFKSFEAPQPSDPFVVHSPAGLAGRFGGAAPTPTGPLTRERPQELAKPHLVINR